MTETIQPFFRLPSIQQETGWPLRTLRLMRGHFTLAGLLLLAGALGLAGYLYSLEFERVELASDLRIEQPGDIYRQSVQLQLAGALLFGVGSLIQLQAVRRLRLRQRSALGYVRLSALMLMAGFPVSLLLWWMVSTSPDVAEDSGLMQQLLQDVAWVVRIAAILIFAQSALAAWYFVSSFLAGMRDLCRVRPADSLRALRWLQRLGVALGAAVLIGLGLALGVFTDWLYELPVPRPEPGELLYATSFDRFNDEWDLYPGRDSAQVPATLDPARLEITYGSGKLEEIVWSTLDRKFNDMDLRVTARLVDGPVDQNQYGVIFRYRDEQNFYVFRITADGYYSLTRVKDGLQEKISDWGLSDAIHQGDAANDIRVKARGDEFEFFVNGQPMPLCFKGENLTSMWTGPGECYTDQLQTVFRDGTFKQGRVALAAGTIDGSEVTVAFDDVLIVGPEWVENP